MPTKYTNLQRSAERRIVRVSQRNYSPGANARIRVQVFNGFGRPAWDEWVIFRVVGENGTAAAWTPITLLGQGIINPTMARGSAKSVAGPDQAWAEVAITPNSLGTIEVELPHIGAGGLRQVEIIAGSARTTLPQGITL